MPQHGAVVSVHFVRGTPAPYAAADEYLRGGHAGVARNFLCVLGGRLERRGVLVQLGVRLCRTVQLLLRHHALAEEHHLLGVVQAVLVAALGQPHASRAAPPDGLEGVALGVVHAQCFDDVVALGDVGLALGVGRAGDVHGVVADAAAGVFLVGHALSSISALRRPLMHTDNLSASVASRL
ncbi:hypothetical protein D3C78_917430 [compost metagenome]